MKISLLVVEIQAKWSLWQKLFAIRYSINQAVQVHNVAQIIVITNAREPQTLKSNPKNSEFAIPTSTSKV